MVNLKNYFLGNLFFFVFMKYYKITEIIQRTKYKIWIEKFHKFQNEVNK